MKNQRESNSFTKNSKEELYDKEFLGYTNTLLIAVKKFYKVINNLANYQKSLILGMEEKLNISESSLEKILKNDKNNNKIHSFNNCINNLKDFCNKLKLNNTLEERNLLIFYEDVKILFKKMRGKNKTIERERSISWGGESLNNQILNTSKNSFDTLKKHLKKKYTQNSEFSTKNKEMINSMLEIDYNKRPYNEYLLNNKFYPSTDKVNNKKQRNYKLNMLSKDKFNNELSLNIENKLTIRTRNDLYSRNKQLSCDLNALNSNLANSMKENNNQNKDKLILALKEEKNKSNEKIIELIKNLNNYKKEIEKLKKENISLKQSDLSITNYSTKNNDNKKSKENNILTEGRAYIKSKSFYTLNYNYKKKANNNNKMFVDNHHHYILKYSNRNRLLKKKLIIMEKNVSVKKKLINELNNKKNLLKNKNQSDILELKNEIINNSNELKNLKKLKYNQTNNDYSKNILENNMKIIIANYKKENEEIKKINKNQKIEIENYQTELKNKENELKFNSENIIKELEEKYKKKIKDLKESNKYYNRENASNEIKILNLKFQIEQLNQTIQNKEKEISKLLLKSKMISSDIENNKNEEIENLKKNLENQKILNNNLNEEISNLKKDNEFLKNEIMINKNKLSEIKQNKDKNILNNQIKNSQNESLIVKSNNEKLENQLKQNYDSFNNIEDRKDEKLKWKNEKELISKLQKEKQKIDDEVNFFKEEKKTLKNKLIHFSNNIPGENNDVKKQNIDLKNKFKKLIKNRNYNKPITEKKNKSINYINRITIEEQLINELKKAKNEIEIITKEKKQNKEIDNDFYDFNNKTRDFQTIIYEEDYNLRKLSNYLKDKNNSRFININYPNIKKKFREINFSYISLENLVKKLLLNIQINGRNKEFVKELCKKVGFDPERTMKILANDL